MVLELSKTMFGALVLALALVICYQYFRILKNVYRNEEVALTLFFVDDRGPRAFQLLAGVGFAYVGGSILVMIGTLHLLSFGTLFEWFGSIVTTSDVLFSFIPKVATLVALLGVIQFQRIARDITTPPSEREE